ALCHGRQTVDQLHPHLDRAKDAEVEEIRKGDGVSKISIMDKAIHDHDITSFADLGGVWAVNGAYSLHAMQYPQMRYGYLVDFSADMLTGPITKVPNLFIIQDSFANACIPFVDMILLFDVLLHQTRPNWKDILKLYADRTRCFVICNPQFEIPQTTRLIDLGKTEYFKFVPHSHSEPGYRELFVGEYKTNPDWRDAESLWQWGITNEDLIETLAGLHFKLAHHQAENQLWKSP